MNDESSLGAGPDTGRIQRLDRIDEMLADQPEMLDPVAVAQLLAVSDRTVTAWLREGRLPGYKLGAGAMTGGVWRISREDLREFVKAGANKPTTDVREAHKNVGAP